MKTDNYIKEFLNLIRNCSVDNTYKMAWGKALVELASEELIVAIEERNKFLLRELKNDPILKNKKPTEELEIAINRDFIRKFWINCRN